LEQATRTGIKSRAKNFFISSSVEVDVQQVHYK
jgi:hypothetical protein